MLLAISGLLVMGENKSALAWFTTGSMTPNTSAFDGLRELVDLLSDNGIETSPLDLALEDVELHLEGPDAGGLLLPTTANGCSEGDATGLFLPKFPFSPFWVCNEMAYFTDLNTHIVLKQNTITMLTETPRSFLRSPPENESRLLETADTAIHELIHAMIARTSCFILLPWGSDELLVRDITARIIEKVQLSLMSDAGVDNSGLQRLYGVAIANSLHTYPEGRGCFEILGLVNTWSQFGHDPQHTLSSPFTGPTSSDLKWPTPFSDGGRYFSSVSIGMDGTIYVAGSTNDTDGILYALKPDKSLKWSKTLNNLGGVSPAIGPDGTVYIGSSGKLYAFLPNGSLKWDPLEFYPGWEVAISSPVIASNGLIYVTLGFAGGLEKLFAVDPSGATPAERIKWAYQPPADINADANKSPTIGPDGTIYALFTKQGQSLPGTTLVALAPDSLSGSLKWRFSAGSGVRLSMPSIDRKGNLYVGASNGKLYAVTPTGRTKWVKRIGGDLSFSTPAIDPYYGTLYVGSSNGNLYAINSGNGTPRVGWKIPYHTGGSLQTSPALGWNAVLYFTSFDGYSYAVKTDKSTVFKILTGGNGAPPSIGPGETVYFVGGQSVIAVGPDPAVGPDYSPPITEITSGTILANTATFTWTGFDDLTPTSGLEYAFYLQGFETTYSAFSATTIRLYANLPDGTYTFFVKAKDQAGNEDLTPDTATVTVVSAPPTTVSIKASPTCVRGGGNSSISWSASPSTLSCTVSGPGYSSGTLTGAGLIGSATVNVTAQSSYTISCTDGGSTINKSVTVRVSGCSGTF